MAGKVNVSASMDTRDWLMCFLCQCSTSEALVKPSMNKRLKQHPEQLEGALRNVIDNIQTLKQLGELPDDVTVGDIDGFSSDTDVSHVVNLLKSNDVVWHKGCKNKVDNQKVERAQLKRMNALVNVSPVKTRRVSNEGPSQGGDTCQATEEPPEEEVCLLCDKAGGKSLRKAATFGLDAKVRRCAAIISDKQLLRKLSSGDMIAIDAVYHLTCLTKLYRQAASIECPEDQGDHKTKFLKAQAFAELVDYIESRRNTPTVFKMADVAYLYSSRLVSLGVDGYVHTTRLRHKLTAALPDFIEVKSPSNRTDLAFDKDVSLALQEITESCDSEAMVLVKAAKILRQHMLNMTFDFTGSFSTDSEVKSVPPILLSFQQMILDGPGIMKGKSSAPVPASVHVHAAALSVSQLIMYNSVKQRSTNPDSIPRHIRDRENPLVIYIAIKIYANTRMASLVDSMHERGLCISYYRLRTISTDLANSIISFYEVWSFLYKLYEESSLQMPLTI